MRIIEGGGGLGWRAREENLSVGRGAGGNLMLMSSGRRHDLQMGSRRRFTRGSMKYKESRYRQGERQRETWRMMERTAEGQVPTPEAPFRADPTGVQVW